MREIQAAEAQTHLDQLLDDVERGEDLIATGTQQEIDGAIEGIRALRKGKGKITFEELQSAREEGRKY
jgi:antitoxin (DNA-binding transcriptional repressor) of toxin-antitoxin stability system